jgi:hypothetical protein
VQPNLTLRFVSLAYLCSVSSRSRSSGPDSSKRSVASGAICQAERIHGGAG